MKSLLLPFLFAALAANAETYTEKFDSSVNLPEGWEVVGGDFYTFDTGSTYYMNSDRDYAHSGSQSICCANSSAEQWLVTPKVTGQLSFYTRAYRKTRACSIRVYRVSDDGQTLGSEITSAARSWAKNVTPAWEQVNINLGAEGTRLAFVCNFAYIDDFTGTIYSEETEVRGLCVDAVRSLMEGTELIADTDNKLTLSFEADIRNTGNIDLTPGDEGYSLTLLNNSTGEVIKNVDFIEVLAAGATTTIRIDTTLTVSTTLEGKDITFAVRENLTQTEQLTSEKFTIVAYLPRMYVYDADPTSHYNVPLTYSDIINFGNIAEPMTGTFWVANEGTAPLIITSVTALDGYTVEPTEMTVPSKGLKTFTVTLTPEAGNYGAKEGDVVLHAEGLEDYHLSVKGITRDPESVYITFDDKKFPIGWTADNNWRIERASYLSDDYYAEQYQYPAEEVSSLTSPKLNVIAGDEFSFHAKAYSTSSWYNAQLRLYYSADLVNWSLVEDLTEALLTFEEGENTDEFKDFVFDELPAGNWYFRFEALNADIDNIMGLRFAKDAPQISIFAKVEDAEPAQLAAGSTIDFGVTKTEDVTRVISIQNSGTGTLEVTAIDAPKGFTASPATLSLEAGQAADVTLTMTAETTEYGSREGLLTITDNELPPFQLTLSGIVRDPQILFVDFEEVGLLAGWYDDGWNVEKAWNSDNHYADSHSNNGEAVLISPQLTAAEGQQLAFVAKHYGNSEWYAPTLRVSYSADRNEWIPLADLTEQLTAEFQPFAFDIPAGTWYIRFEGIHTEIDDITGLRTEAVADYNLYVSANWPESGEVNHIFTASVDVTNLGSKPINFTSELLIDGEVVATNSGRHLELASNTNVEFSYMPHAELTDIEAVIRVIPEEGLDTITATTTLSILAESSSYSTHEFSGTVTSDNGMPIGNATLALVSEDDVRYSATTDENGAFTLSIHQAWKTYALTITADDFLTLEGSLNIDDFLLQDTVFVLTPVLVDGINSLKADPAALHPKPSTLNPQPSYTLDGRRLSGIPARRGIYIKAGKKTINL